MRRTHTPGRFPLCIYARREPTVDGAWGKLDVCFYSDSGCTKFVGRIPWHQKQPDKRNKWQMLNCYRWRLIWREPFYEGAQE